MQINKIWLFQAVSSSLLFNLLSPFHQQEKRFWQRYFLLNRKWGFQEKRLLINSLHAFVQNQVFEKNEISLDPLDKIYLRKGLFPPQSLLLQLFWGTLLPIKIMTSWRTEKREKKFQKLTLTNTHFTSPPQSMRHAHISWKRKKFRENADTDCFWQYLFFHVTYFMAQTISCSPKPVNFFTHWIPRYPAFQSSWRLLNHLHCGPKKVKSFFVGVMVGSLID